VRGGVELLDQGHGGDSPGDEASGRGGHAALGVTSLAVSVDGVKQAETAEPGPAFILYSCNWDRRQDLLDLCRPFKLGLKKNRFYWYVLNV
jgi:hypothetical protein